MKPSPEFQPSGQSRKITLEPYYLSADVTLYHANATDLLPLLDDIDLTVTDPPYETTAARWDSLPESYWEMLAAVGKPVVMTTGGPFTFTAVAQLDIKLRHRWIWVRGNKATGFLDCKRRPLRIFEDVLFFSPTGRYVFNPQKWQGKMVIQANPRPKRSTLYGGHAVATHYASDQRYPLDVFCFPTVEPRQRLHPTEKPIELLRYLIRTYSKPGQLICDPTCGSGTTLLAARLEGRRAVGIELNKEFCEATVRRLTAQRAA